MSRILKFRSWNTANKRMYDDLDPSSSPQYTSLNLYLERKQAACVLMQFTGLLDKNGKEIYEGDIVRTRDGDTQVIWWLAGFYFKYLINKDRGDFVKLDSKEMEIIGNVYENSELLHG